jgi:hypothetical protein
MAQVHCPKIAAERKIVGVILFVRRIFVVCGIGKLSARRQRNSARLPFVTSSLVAALFGFFFFATSDGING